MIVPEGLQASTRSGWAAALRAERVLHGSAQRRAQEVVRRRATGSTGAEVGASAESEELARLGTRVDVAPLDAHGRRPEKATFPRLFGGLDR